MICKSFITHDLKLLKFEGHLNSPTVKQALPNSKLKFPCFQKNTSVKIKAFNKIAT